MKRRFIYLVLVLLITLSGCTSEKIIDESKKENIAIPVGGADGEILERSENISDIVVELYGIDDATTIILNNTAIIGLKIAYDQKLTDETIKIIEEKVISYDDSLTEVIVTDKDKIFSEISDIVYDLLQGSSYDSLVDEINKIKNKIK
ncbi:YhcN/YlaJ family sporulation lipoprotein [Tissierella sp. Yu-01]|uniref:YhcN/YlaJ family sporulation lipoprotein n=1 Tax=Tissierella sp. Yu-01 TaxID=3035694 RepID=UPI00240D0573|nr:YhcN/YlaJ family sporulation lipoprotein [Tissierella sp. Yu-01]WFA09620.1 YhcN/YlaJ family sporulation lipoprotein [Tissierella sp. Yu-01]